MDIGSVLMQIADKLGIAVNQIFEIYVGGQRYEAFANFVALTIVLFSSFGVPLLLSRRIQWEGDYGELKIFGITFEGTGTDFMWFFTGIFVVLLFTSLGIALFLHDTILRLMAPEYTALKELIQALAVNH